MLKWFLVLRSFTVAAEQRRPVLDEHLEWMKHQHEEGTVLLSGPDADGQLGIYLLRAPSHEAADALARSDPFTAKGLARFDLIEWEVHQAFGLGSFEAKALES